MPICPGIVKHLARTGSDDIGPHPLAHEALTCQLIHNQLGALVRRGILKMDELYELPPFENVNAVHVQIDVDMHSYTEVTVVFKWAPVGQIPDQQCTFAIPGPDRESI